MTRPGDDLADALRATAALLAGGAVGIALSRPWLRTGATREEVRASLPGDDSVGARAQPSRRGDAADTVGTVDAEEDSWTEEVSWRTRA